MSSIREQILVKIVTVLAGTSGVGSNIFRSRVIPLTRTDAPSIVVRPSNGMEHVTLLGSLVAERLLSVDIEIYVRGDPADSLVDPIISSAHAKIMADTTLGGLCARITEQGSQWADKEADLTAGVLTVQYQIKYLSQAGDITKTP